MFTTGRDSHQPLKRDIFWYNQNKLAAAYGQPLKRDIFDTVKQWSGCLRSAAGCLTKRLIFDILSALKLMGVETLPRLRETKQVKPLDK